MQNLKDLFITDIYLSWCYIYTTYFSNNHDDLSPPHLPLTVILDKGSERLAPVIINDIIIDHQQKTITVLTANLGQIIVDRKNPWRVRLGKTNDNRNLTTTYLE